MKLTTTQFITLWGNCGGSIVNFKTAVQTFDTMELEEKVKKVRAAQEKAIADKVDKNV